MSALVDVNTLTVEQMTALVAQLEAKKQEAEARQRAEEDAKRKEEEARRKAAEKKRLAEAEERKRVEGDKKKTGAESSVRCAACIKANAECTFSAASIRATSCDRCRTTKSACTLSKRAEKPKRKKRADTEEEEEEEAESSCGDKKRRRRRSLMEAEDEVDERGLVVAALEVLADKIGQVSEELASNRKTQQKMVTVLDNIFRALESRKEGDASVKFE